MNPRINCGGLQTEFALWQALNMTRLSQSLPFGGKATGLR